MPVLSSFFPPSLPGNCNPKSFCIFTTETCLSWRMGLSSGWIFHIISLFWGINSGWEFFSGLLQSKGQADKNQLLQCYSVKVPVPVKINSSQAQGPGGFCHCLCLWSRKRACYQLTLFLCPQCSPCRRQIYFLFTNKAATPLFSNPSDELWMLPGLIFIKSVTKKDHIFPLHPFHRIRTTKIWPGCF